MATPKKSLAKRLKQDTDSKIVMADSISPEASTDATQRYVTPARRGKKAVSGHFDPAVQRQLNQMALDEDASVQALLREAINDLFAKRGKPTIA
jgi:hypothetical protein